MGAAMFVTAPAPQVGGLVRSGMGTRLGRVLYCMPHPQGLPGWLCHVMPLGAVRNGTLPSQGYATAAPRWVHVHPNSRRGMHPVVPGRAAPPMPGLTRWHP